MKGAQHDQAPTPPSAFTNNAGGEPSLSSEPGPSRFHLHGKGADEEDLALLYRPSLRVRLQTALHAAVAWICALFTLPDYVTGGSNGLDDRYARLEWDDIEEEGYSVAQGKEFVLRFARALANTDMATHKVTDMCTTLAKSLGIEASFLVLHSTIILPPDHSLVLTFFFFAVSSTFFFTRSSFASDRPPPPTAAGRTPAGHGAR